MKQIIAVACLVSIVAFAVRAADADYTAETGYVTAINNSSQSWRLPTTWSTGISPVDLTVATNYYIGTTRGVNGLTSEEANAGYASVKFPADGSKLVVAGTFTHTAAGTTKPYYGDMTFLPGSKFAYNSVGEILSGDFTIRGTAENPVVSTIARKENTTRTLISAANFHSDATGCMRLDKTDYAGYTPWQNFKYTGDWSDFKGTFIFPKNDGVYVCNNFDSPGAFQLRSNSVLRVIGNNAKAAFGRMDIQPYGVFWPEYATSETTVGTLDVAANGIVEKVNVSQKALAVTNRLTVGAGAVVKIQTAINRLGQPASTTAVFRLSPQAVSAGVPDVSTLVPVAVDQLGELPRLAPCLYDDPDVAGGKIVGLAIGEYVAMTNTSLALKSALDLEYNHPEEYWSDGQYPSEGKDYLLSAQLLFNKSGNPYVFPGRSCVANAVVIGMYSSVKDITFTNLYLCGNSSFRPMSDSTTYYFRGKVSLLKGAARARIAMRNKQNFILAADVHGDNDLGILFQDLAKPPSYSASQMNVTCRLMGNNVNYTGKICVATTNDAYLCSNGSVVAFDREHTATLRVTAPENLGGPLDAFAYDALTISNRCRLAIDATATFADLTRGWCFPRTAYLFVTNGATATCRNTLTIGGELVKEGEGTLLLAAKPVLSGGEAALTVTNGILAVGVSDALDGLPVAFAAGTALGLDMSSADATFAAKGLVLADTSIAVAAAPLPVALYGMPAQPEDAVGMEYPLLTYATEQAETIAATYVLRNPYPQTGYTVLLSEAANGDGTMTLKARVHVRGTHVIVR